MGRLRPRANPLAHAHAETSLRKESSSEGQVVYLRRPPGCRMSCRSGGRPHYGVSCAAAGELTRDYTARRLPMPKILLAAAAAPTPKPDRRDTKARRDKPASRCCLNSSFTM